MWIERTPKHNETVKVTFSEISKLGTKIGIVLPRDCANGLCVDFGQVRRFLDRSTTFLVYQP